MTRNQLPEGVGKKIVEALKRQEQADITIMDDNNNLSNSVPLTDIGSLDEIQSAPSVETINLTDNDVIVEEEIPAELSEGVFKEKEEVFEPKIEEKVKIQENTNTTNSFTFQQQNIKAEPVQNISSVNINIPSNVLVLKNLIANLPVGVTKQTGAQIIRQTLEAMGLPMNSVLKQAQSVQEELNSSTRECMLKIQEYKTHILQLEQSVQDYQKNISQINDLVSLFLLTDRQN